VFFAGICAVAALVFAAQALELTRLVWVLERAMALAAIGVLVIFQPEIRRGLVRLGQSSFANLFARTKSRVVDEVVEAVTSLAKNRIGALIALERDVSLGDYAEGGVRLDARLSAQLIVSLFMRDSPLHDGAAIVRAGRVAAAGCLLPLTDNPDVSRTLGTRHRAGIGLTEDTDAVTVIVSQETGRVSVGVRGELMQGLSVEDLRGILKTLCAEVEFEALHSA